MCYTVTKTGREERWVASVKLAEQNLWEYYMYIQFQDHTVLGELGYGPVP